MQESKKPYDLTLEIRPRYLYARVRSETTNQLMAVTYLHEIVSMCKKLNRTRLLLERNIPTALSETEVYFSGTDFAHMGIEDLKIAVIDERPENAEDLELAILVQNNRGANIKLFDNATDAEEWLIRPLPHLTHPEDETP